MIISKEFPQFPRTDVEKKSEEREMICEKRNGFVTDNSSIYDNADLSARHISSKTTKFCCSA